MNITEEAIKAAAEAIDFNHDWTYEGGVIYCMDCGLRVEGFVPRKYASHHSAVQRHRAQVALEAAEPYLRRRWVDEINAKMPRWRNGTKNDFARGVKAGINYVLYILEGDE